MNKLLKGLIITLCLPLTLAACGTTPASKFYLLSAQTTTFPTGSTPSLGVGPIEIPISHWLHPIIGCRSH